MYFRLARHSNNLDQLVEFYTKVLNLELLGSFENHDNYDGVFLGKKDEGWHLEFTSSKDKAKHLTDPDDALVFYPKTKPAYQAIIANLKENKIEIIKAQNPYWNQYGTMFKDPDGFNIVVSNLKIE